MTSIGPGSTGRSSATLAGGAACKLEMLTRMRPIEIVRDRVIGPTNPRSPQTSTAASGNNEDAASLGLRVLQVDYKCAASTNKCESAFRLKQVHSFGGRAYPRAPSRRSRTIVLIRQIDD